jgi:hypothetical protein
MKDGLLEVGDELVNTNGLDSVGQKVTIVRVTKTKAIAQYPSGTHVDLNRKISSYGLTYKKAAWKWDSNVYKLIEKYETV